MWQDLAGAPEWKTARKAQPGVHDVVTIPHIDHRLAINTAKLLLYYAQTSTGWYTDCMSHQSGLY